MLPAKLRLTQIAPGLTHMQPGQLDVAVKAQPLPLQRALHLLDAQFALSERGRIARLRLLPLEIVMLLLPPVPMPAQLELALHMRQPRALGANPLFGLQNLALRLRQIAADTLDMTFEGLPIMLQRGPFRLHALAQQQQLPALVLEMGGDLVGFFRAADFLVIDGDLLGSNGGNLDAQGVRQSRRTAGLVSR